MIENENKNFENIIDLKGELKKYGIEGKYFYLLDVIPLIELAWADGKIQKMELNLIKKFIEKHILNINNAAGSNILTFKDGYDFIEKFTKERPNPQLMKILRSMIVPLRLKSKNPEKDYNQKINIIKFCLDIGSCCVKNYPYGERDRFDEDEKNVFIEIVKTLGVSPEREI